MADKILRALVVDDSPMMRVMEEKALTAIGIPDIMQAADGAEALSLLDRGRYDLMILDLVMPEMDGVEVARKIRESSGINKNIPILMVTGDTSAKTARQIANLRVNGFVTKPFTLRDLEEKISAVLNTGQVSKT